MYDYIEPMRPFFEKHITKARLEEEDDLFLKAVYSVGINVDKERLVQALTDAKDFYEEGYMKALHRDRWIYLKDRQPPKSGSYIIATKNGAVCTAHWYEESGRFSSPAGKNAKCWMPLPEFDVETEV